MVGPKTEIQIMKIIVLDRIFEIGIVDSVDAIHHETLELLPRDVGSPVVIVIRCILDLGVGSNAFTRSFSRLARTSNRLGSVLSATTLRNPSFKLTHIVWIIFVRSAVAHGLSGLVGEQFVESSFAASSYK